MLKKNFCFRSSLEWLTFSFIEYPCALFVLKVKYLSSYIEKKRLIEYSPLLERFQVRKFKSFQKRDTKWSRKKFCEPSMLLFFHINVTMMMRSPNLGGTFDYGSFVSGENKNINLITLTRKNFEKHFTFPMTDMAKFNQYWQKVKRLLLLSCWFNHHDINLKYDICSVFRWTQNGYVPYGRSSHMSKWEFFSILQYVCYGI